MILWSLHFISCLSVDVAADQIQILMNILLLYASLVLSGLQCLLYGPLGSLEIEKLYERFSMTPIEIILATVNLGLKIDGCFMLMFVGILVGKVWTWMGEGRLRTHEQQPLLTSKLRCVRFLIVPLLSLSLGGSMVVYAINAMQPTIVPSTMILVAFDSVS